MYIIMLILKFTNILLLLLTFSVVIMSSDAGLNAYIRIPSISQNTFGFLMVTYAYVMISCFAVSALFLMKRIEISNCILLLPIFYLLIPGAFFWWQSNPEQKEKAEVNKFFHEERDKRFMLAVIKNNEIEAKQALSSGAKPDLVALESMTPLLFSVKWCNYPAAELLLKLGANPNFSPWIEMPSETSGLIKWIWNPFNSLNTRFDEPSIECRLKMSKLLLNSGGVLSPNDMDFLFDAVKEPLSQEFLEQSLKSVIPHFKEQLAMYAIDYRRFENAKIILGLGANPALEIMEYKSNQKNNILNRLKDFKDRYEEAAMILKEIETKTK